MSSAVAPALVRWAFAALLLVACGGKATTTSSEPPVATETNGLCRSLGPSTTDALQNCALYCRTAGCNCGQDVGECTSACTRDYDAGHLNQACLACAIDQIDQLDVPLTCDGIVSTSPAGGTVFTVTFPETQCGSVCNR
jgi:hypothetical protein